MRTRTQLLAVYLFIGGVSLGSLFGAGCAGTQSADEAVTGSKVFQGPDGISVGLIELAKDPAQPEGPDALIQVGGSASQIDSIPFDYKIVKVGKALTYVTRFSGADFTAFKNEGGPTGKWTLFLPENPAQGIEMTFSPEATKSIVPGEIYTFYQELKTNGKLATRQNFDRPSSEQRVSVGFVALTQPFQDKCGATPKAEIKFNGLDDGPLRGTMVPALCAAPIAAMASLCEKSPSAKAFLLENVKQIHCAFAKAAEPTLAIAGGTLTWTVPTDATDLNEAATKAVGAVSAGDATLQALVALDGTYMCLHEKTGKYLVFGPEGSNYYGISWGDGAQFTTAPIPAGVGAGYFYDPRFFNEKSKPDVNGVDLRIHSRIEINPAESKCNVVCGSKRKKLALMAPADSQPMVSGAAFEKAPMVRIPVALATDAKGTHYLVDRAGEADKARDFALYIGTPGKMVKAALKSADADGDAEVLSTKAGKLRVTVGKTEASWTVGKKSTALTWVPVGDNLLMIFTTLGAYKDARFGNPCDDLISGD
jgi:hypothetical protein